MGVQKLAGTIPWTKQGIKPVVFVFYQVHINLIALPKSIVDNNNKNIPVYTCVHVH